MAFLVARLKKDCGFFRTGKVRGVDAVQGLVGECRGEEALLVAAYERLLVTVPPADHGCYATHYAKFRARSR